MEAVGNISGGFINMTGGCFQDLLSGTIGFDRSAFSGALSQMVILLCLTVKTAGEQILKGDTAM